MRVHVMDLNIGDSLLIDTFNSYGLHLLSSGTKLREQDISKLLRHQVTYVDVAPKQEDIPFNDYNVLTEESFRHLRPLYDQAIKGTEQLFAEAQSSGRVNDRIVQESFVPITKYLKEQRDVVELLLVLNRKDDYTYQHSIQTGILSYHIATWIGYSEAEALLIGTAGYLHDIGKCRIDPELLSKQEELTDEEQQLLAKHTNYGYEIIHKSGYPYPIALAALQHHERMDGSGYPFQLSGTNIHPYTRIITVADIYSGMISNRPHHIKQDLLTVLQYLFELSFSKLDAPIAHTFISHMLPNFIGKNVLLHTGEVGKIIMNNNTDYFRPLIQVEDRFIDLSAERSLEIEEIYM